MSPRGKICRKNFKRHESIVSNEGKFLDLVGSRLTKKHSVISEKS